MKKALIRRRFNFVDAAFFVMAGAFLGNGYELLGLAAIALGYLAGSVAEALLS